MNPQPGRRSAFQWIMAAEARAARARMVLGDPGDPEEVTSELYRLMPRRRPEPPVQAHPPAVAPETTVDRRHKHRDLWVVLAGALILGGPTLGLTIWAVENSQQHVGFWPHAGEVGSLALMVLGGFLVAALICGWWLPGGFDMTAEARETEPTPDGGGTAAQPALLPTLRTLAVEGRSLQGRITERGPMAGMPSGLPDRVEGWERTVREALQSRPELCAQFEAAANPGTRFVVIRSATDDLHRRLESELSVLEAIVRGLAGPGGEG
jgi:hypothetical protein